MSIDGARALVEKVLSDEELAKQINETNTESEFTAVVGKWGYQCSMDEFKDASREIYKKQAISDEQLDQASGGLCLTGVDFIAREFMRV